MGGCSPPMASVKDPFIQHCLEPSLTVRVHAVVTGTFKITEPFFPGPTYGLQVIEEYINSFPYNLHVAARHILAILGWVIDLGKINPDAPVSFQCIKLRMDIKVAFL